MKNTRKIAKYKTVTSEVTYYNVRQSDWVIRVSRNTLGMQSVVVLTWSEYEEDVTKIESQRTQLRGLEGLAMV